MCIFQELEREDGTESGLSRTWANKSGEGLNRNDLNYVKQIGRKKSHAHKSHTIKIHRVLGIL